LPHSLGLADLASGGVSIFLIAVSSELGETAILPALHAHLGFDSAGQRLQHGKQGILISTDNPAIDHHLALTANHSLVFKSPPM
jgi:hypothetical protein